MVSSTRLNHDFEGGPMSTKMLARVAVLAVLCALGSATVFAQLQSGRIVGTIFDPQRSGIPGATVTVTNVATNLARTAVTDSEGNYVVTPLDPGTYNVSAEVPGFQKTVRNGLELTVGQSSRVELELNLGALSTEVQVTAETPLLNTESATLSEVITNEQIVDLPLNGRGFHELARLTSGVALLPPTGNTQPVRPEVVNGNVIGGVAGSQTRFLLDGVDITEEHQGGTWIQTSVDALQEFSVQQNAYSAEFHGAGATFNVTTKSGGNAFHGSLFEFMRDDAFDSKNFFAVNKEKLERNQFGGTLGGPVMIPGMYDGRNKTFFFASYEGHRRQQGIVDVSNAPAVCEQSDSGESHFAAGAVLPPVHPITKCAEQPVRVEPDHIVQRRSDDPSSRPGDQPAASVLRSLQQTCERRNQTRSLGDPRVDTSRRPGIQRRDVADLEFRFVTGSRAPLQQDVRRVPVDRVFPGARGQPRSAAGRRERARRNSGSEYRQ